MSFTNPQSENPVPAPRLTYSIAETAKLLSVSQLTIKKYCYNGQLKSRLLGRRRLIPHNALEQFIRNLPQG